MATSHNSPATKADIDNLRNEILQYYATKADLAHMETRLLVRLAGIIVAAVSYTHLTLPTKRIV